MRSALLMLALSAAVGLAAPALAQKAGRAPSSTYKGIWISTPFPVFNAPGGEAVTLDLNVHNAGSPPQTVALRRASPFGRSVTNTPTGVSRCCSDQKVRTVMPLSRP